MRLLASVHARMHSQSRALDELLATARVIADVRADAAVDTLCVFVSIDHDEDQKRSHTVSSQVAATSKALAASGAGKCLGQTTSCCARTLLLRLLVVHRRRLVHGLLVLVLGVAGVRWRGSVRVVAVLDHGHRLMHLGGRWVAHASSQVVEGLWVGRVVERGWSLG